MNLAYGALRRFIGGVCPARTAAMLLLPEPKPAYRRTHSYVPTRRETPIARRLPKLGRDANLARRIDSVDEEIVRLLTGVPGWRGG